MARTTIEWVVALAEARGALPESWNPVLGCSRASAGCANCYAAAIAHRFGSGRTSPFAGLTDTDPRGVPRYTGMIRVQSHRLMDPLRWRKPRVVFVGDMADLFHEGVSDDTLDRVFAAMALAPQHLFLLLTKRPERMRERITSLGAALTAAEARDWGGFLGSPLATATRAVSHAAGDSVWANAPLSVGRWPLPNVILGVTAEDQAAADARRGDMAALAAAGWHTFVSYEPALGPVDWDGWEFLRWLVSGGESGPHARPSHPDWFRAARDWARVSGVPYLHKQWGEWKEAFHDQDGPLVHDVDCYSDAANAMLAAVSGPPGWVTHDGRFARSYAEMEALRRPGDPDEMAWRLVERLGKARAGRLLDGRTHDEVPDIGRAAPCP